MKAEKKLSPKVKALYEAVEELIFENIDVKEIKVSDITERAGIGKGTAYEYFRNKEEIISRIGKVGGGGAPENAINTQNSEGGCMKVNGAATGKIVRDVA